MRDFDSKYMVDNYDRIAEENTQLRARLKVTEDALTNKIAESAAQAQEIDRLKERGQTISDMPYQGHHAQT